MFTEKEIDLMMSSVISSAVDVPKELQDRLSCFLHTNNSPSTVVEVCPHCDTEVEFRWDVKADGYEAHCPYCGKRLMLCSECVHRTGEFHDDCNYDTKKDTCRFCKTERPVLDDIERQKKMLFADGYHDAVEIIEELQERLRYEKPKILAVRVRRVGRCHQKH